MTAGAVSAAIGPLLNLPFGSLAENELLGLMRDVETARRQLEALDARLIAEAQQRNNREIQPV
ncbi:MAG: hypothetical protein ABI140_01270 [Jatrophihabitantaceae bacterium]